MANKNTVVRGPDGALYVLSKTAPPAKLTEQQAQKLTEILADAEQKFEDTLYKEISTNIEAGCFHAIHITIPDVSME